MHYSLDQFEAHIRDGLLAAGVPAELIEIVAPKPNIPADLAFPTFRAARALGVAPPALAQRLADGFVVGGGSLIGAVHAAGPFLNFSLDQARLTTAVLDEVARLGDAYGHDDAGAGEVVVVDYSAPNIAKRMHVGHIRSTIIGQSVVNILRAYGCRVIGDNHLGDWGKQFGAIIAAVMHYGEPAEHGEAALAAFEELYTRYSALIKHDRELRDEAERWRRRLEEGDAEALERRDWITALVAQAAEPNHDDQARAWSLRLERGDPQARALWQRTIDLTIEVNDRLYRRLGVRIDHAYGESFYEPMLAAVIDEALAKGVAYRDDAGAVVVDELEPNLPTFLLQRSDGGTLYMTRDVATIQFRVRQMQPTRIVYVLGIPQELHLRQLFALVRAVGYATDIELVHVKFGTVFDQHGQALSTRRGNMVYLEPLLDEAHARALAVVRQSSGELDPAEQDEIAEAVGIGAVIYNDLYQDPRRDIRLDWDRMLALDGNSAPYIQYMVARCRSIVRRAAAEPGAVADIGQLTHPSELAVIKQLARLPRAVREAAQRYAPFVIAEWCYDTARALSALYRDCPVLRAEQPELRSARLQLVAATAQALTNGLALLCIRAPQRM
jgi:arginyl-tRNA synthetase